MIEGLISLVNLISIQILTTLFFLITGLLALFFPQTGYKIACLLYKKRPPLPTKRKLLVKRVGGGFVTFLAILLLFLLRPTVGAAPDMELLEHSGEAAELRGELVEDSLSAYLESYSISSAAIGIISDGELSYHIFNNRFDAIYEIGSLSKVFTGIMLAKSLEDGVVSLEEPLNNYLPGELNGRNSYFNSVNLKQLATHTSGFPRMPLIKSRLPAMFFRSYLMGNPNAVFSDELIYDDLLLLKPKAEPGKSFAYSNYGVGLLGHILALRYNRKGYEELLKEMISQPLALNDTTISLNKNQQWRFSPGYGVYFPLGSLRVGIKSKPWNYPDTLAGAGAIRSTIFDMTAFLKANMEVAESFYATAQQPLYPIDDYMAIGMCWVTSREDELESSLIWHNGQTGGFNCFIGFTADRRHGVVILSNSTKPVDSLAIELLAALED